MLTRRPAPEHESGYPTRKGLMAGLGAGVLSALLLSGCGETSAKNGPTPESEGSKPQPMRPPGASTPTKPGCVTAGEATVPEVSLTGTAPPPDARPQAPVEGSVAPVIPSRGEPPAIPLKTEEPPPVPAPVEPAAPIKGRVRPVEPVRPEAPERTAGGIMLVEPKAVLGGTPIPPARPEAKPEGDVALPGEPIPVRPEMLKEGGVVLMPEPISPEGEPVKTVQPEVQVLGDIEVTREK